MHHQDFSGDAPGSGSRKAAYHYRRGSSSASASGGNVANTGEDGQSLTGSSSPALHHQPQSQVAGAQVKKKSGFQITSVTSAQISVSANNSLADDTESYDDMDESHTEDLSSSDMLDVSVSRATDTGLPERSSSDDTLNSIHGVDTPGIVSPNEPLHPHSIPQGSQQHTSMVNGTMHHPYYPQQQHSQSLHHRSDSFGGGEPPLSPPLGCSTPALASKGGPSISQRTPVLDNLKAAHGTSPALSHNVGGVFIDANQQVTVNASNVTSATSAGGPGVPSPGPSGFDNTNVSGQNASSGGGTVPSAAAASSNSQIQQSHSQHTQTQPGSRFRVVKLDTNSEPFRKGRWTCTEFYEKEIPQPATSEAPKGVELPAETEVGSAGVGTNVPAVQPPHTLQAYQQPTPDFTSPQPMQSPPQGLAHSSPLTYVTSQEAVRKPVATIPIAAPQVTPQVGGSQPPPVLPQQLPYAVDPHQAQSQGGYPAPQFHTGVMSQGSVRQPDFIQPTAPFQTQVQPPPPHFATGMPITSIPGVTAPPPVNITHQLLKQGPAAPTAPLPPQALPHPQTSVQPPSTTTVPVAHTHGNPYMPLTALQADLQPILTPGMTLTQVPHPGGGMTVKSSHLEDAQKLLFQHQGLLGLPRLVTGDGTSEASGASGTLAHMGMSAEASAFMAAAAGLRNQHAEGEEDSSSGASVVAIDNKIEQAMDLVKSHLMYAVREEVEVLKEQIKELIERNSQLEQENNLLKTLASPEQMAQFQAQVQTGGSPTSTGQAPGPVPAGTTQVLPSTQISSSSA